LHGLALRTRFTRRADVARAVARQTARRRTDAWKGRSQTLGSPSRRAQAGGTAAGGPAGRRGRTARPHLAAARYALRRRNDEAAHLRTRLAADHGSRAPAGGLLCVV